MRLQRRPRSISPTQHANRDNPWWIFGGAAGKKKQGPRKMTRFAIKLKVSGGLILMASRAIVAADAPAFIATRTRHADEEEIDFGGGSTRGGRDEKRRKIRWILPLKADACVSFLRILFSSSPLEGFDNRPPVRLKSAVSREREREGGRFRICARTLEKWRSGIFAAGNQLE